MAQDPEQPEDQAPNPDADSSASAAPKELGAADAAARRWAHIAKGRVGELDLSKEDRIFQLKRLRLIRYEHARRVIKEIQDIYDHPRQDRMPNRLVVADSNNGKTQLSKAILRMYLPKEDPDQEVTHVPVIWIEAVRADEKLLFGAILQTLSLGVDLGQSLAQLRAEVNNALEMVDTRMILIDEFHQLLTGSALQQRHVLNELKSLANRHRLSIIGFGTPDAATAIQIDPQWSNRFKLDGLPRWKPDEHARALLKTLEMQMPLKNRSGLGTTEMTQLIVALCDGLLGEMVELVTRAACMAIETGSEQITVKELKGCDYIPPKQRRLQASQLRGSLSP